MGVEGMSYQPAGSILLANFGHYFFGITLSVVSLMLILLVLIQRGRGGGLAGAFGGMGGQSAFGTKAGDTFTRITIGLAIFWLLLSVGAVKFLGQSTGAFGEATPISDTQIIPGPGDSSTTDSADSATPPADGAAPAGQAAPAAGTDAAAPDSSTAPPANTGSAEAGPSDFPAAGAESSPAPAGEPPAQ